MNRWILTTITLLVLSALGMSARGWAQERPEARLEFGAASLRDGVTRERALFRVGYLHDYGIETGPDDPEAFPGHWYFGVDAEIGVRNGAIDYINFELVPLRLLSFLDLSSDTSERGAKYLMDFSMAPVTLSRDRAIGLEQRVQLSLAKARFVFASGVAGSSLLSARVYAGAFGRMMSFGTLRTTDGITDSDQLGGLFNLMMGYEAGLEAFVAGDRIRLRLEPLSEESELSSPSGFQSTRSRSLSADFWNRFRVFLEHRERRFQLNSNLIQIPETSIFRAADGKYRGLSTQEWFLGFRMGLGSRVRYAR